MVSLLAMVDKIAQFWNKLAPEQQQAIINYIATQRVNVKFTKLSPEAHEPTKGSEQAAGWDLYADLGGEGRAVVIMPGECMKISTGIAVALPPNTFGALYPRSGIATKQGLVIANTVGIIDSDYRGPVIAALKNTSNEPQVIDHGMRIAQLVIQPYIPVLFQETSELSDTARGSGGFGSTGTE